ncbi:MAG: hypothetical protein OXJ52_02215 [Oligoflexia bacterium]|nr:hypothetical protein [Oligoflexia bacterium]
MSFPVLVRDSRLRGNDGQTGKPKQDRYICVFICWTFFGLALKIKLILDFFIEF